MNLLIIEDEADLLDSIREYLSLEAFTVESAVSYPEAEEKTELYDYDCVVVDITLPGGSGLDIIRRLKAKDKDTGIIIISARNSLDDKLTGLGIGADDYLTKPFHLPELNARIKSVIRRRGMKGANVRRLGDLTIEFDNRRLLVRNQEVLLTRKEYDLLLYFAMNAERVLSKEDIAEHLWGDDMSLSADSFNFIYNHIKNLRKKILDHGGEDYIKSVYGIGYKFSLE